jgi:hypothetical protein
MHSLFSLFLFTEPKNNEVVLSFLLKAFSFWHLKSLRDKMETPREEPIGLGLGQGGDVPTDLLRCSPQVRIPLG